MPTPTFADGPNSLAAKAWEPWFEPPASTDEDRIFCGKTRCATSGIVPGQNGVFARVDLRRGECYEWGIASIVDDYDVNKTQLLYTWDTQDRTIAAALSGCALYYNTLGDKSNVRCVPYHKEKRYEMYALEDIKAGTELTIRYDSTNWRESFKDLKECIGCLEER